MTDDLSRFLAYGSIEQTVHGVVIGYRLTLTRAPEVETMPYHRGEGLEQYSIRVAISSEQLVVTVDEWAGREDELQEQLRAWIPARADLRGSRLRREARRTDPWWREAWQRANPGRI